MTNDKKEAQGMRRRVQGIGGEGKQRMQDTGGLATVNALAVQA